MSETPITSLRGLREFGETQNQYIPPVKTFSTLRGGLHQSRPDLQPPDTPK